MRAFAALSLFVLCLLFVTGCNRPDEVPAQNSIPPPVNLSRQTPPPGGGKTAADPWYVSLRDAKVKADLTGMTFFCPETADDFPVAGYLLAYGASQRKTLDSLAVDVYISKIEGDDPASGRVDGYTVSNGDWSRDIKEEKRTFEENMLKIVAALSDNHAGDPNHDVAPAEEIGDDDGWWMKFRNPRLAQQVQLENVKFVYNDFPSDWRLDGALLAYGAWNVKDADQANLILTQRAAGPKARKDYSGVYTFKYKGKSFTLPQYWNRQRYDQATRALLWELSDLSVRPIPNGF